MMVLDVEAKYKLTKWFSLCLLDGLMLTKNAEMTVATDAPMKPSHVFFGDSLIKGVFPKKNPKM